MLVLTSGVRLDLAMALSGDHPERSSPSAAPQDGRLRVAIIGGGITGATCAREIARLSAGEFRVVVFDQGRCLGGRAAHRRVRPDGTYLPSGGGGRDQAEGEIPAFAFDHGCQFFRADSERFRSELLDNWLANGWVEEWAGRFTSLTSGALSGDDAVRPDSMADFFGFPSQPPFFCGAFGMSSLPAAVLADAERAGVTVHSGVRVAHTTRLESGVWLLQGTSGKAALHDTSEKEAAAAVPDSLGEYDAVVVTDVSASMAGWHRASAGIPEEMAVRVRSRVRVALFTALFAFERPLQLSHDAFAAEDDVLWFAAKTSSKPGLHGSSSFECWTVVSTPKYAAVEIDRVPMQDPKTGEFRPQEMSYLKDGPCADMLAAFERLLEVNGHTGCLPLPAVVYSGGQRWGSAFPAPVGAGNRDHQGHGSSTVEVLGVAYESAPALPLLPQRRGDGEPLAKVARTGQHRSFIADDEQSLIYAGDYVSSRVPGLETAALSGLDAARHLCAGLLQGRGARNTPQDA